MSHALEVVIVSGLSGSGKTTAIRVLEDLGFYCIDNLPVVLIQRFIELCEQSREGIRRVALGIDVREREFFSEFPHVLHEMQRAGLNIRILFLDASDDVLVRRFSETRRPHPLAAAAGLVAGIQKERELLVGLREQAERILDTSALTVHQLREQLRDLYREPRSGGDLTLILMSFGYKFGLPADADMILDARFMANPFFVDELRPKSGCDPAVAEFVFAHEEANVFIEQTETMLLFLLPLYRREGKSYFTLCIGCTGGMHRSVAVVERLAQRLQAKGNRVQVRHRDIRR